MRWSEAVTLEFVKIYLDHDVLWNPSHVFYRSRKHREQAYSNIQARFNAATSKSVTLPEIKTKIRNLRTTYQQQIQKILQKSNPDSIFEPTLVWFNEMDRCLKNISNRQYSSHSMTQESPEIELSAQMWTEKNTDNSHEDPLSAQSDEDYEESKTYGHNIKEFSSHRKIKKKKNKKLHAAYKSLDVSTLEDEFDLYGKYIAEQLRKMNIKRALQTQLEIQRILSDARISDLYSC